MRLAIIILVILLSLVIVPGILIYPWKGGQPPWQRLEKFSDANNRKYIGNLCFVGQRRRPRKMIPLFGRLRSSWAMLVILVAMAVVLGK